MYALPLVRPEGSGEVGQEDHVAALDVCYGRSGVGKEIEMLVDEVSVCLARSCGVATSRRHQSLFALTQYL